MLRSQKENGMVFKRLFYEKCFLHEHTITSKSGQFFLSMLHDRLIIYVYKLYT